MPIELPIFWTVVLNVLGWPVLYLAMARFALRLPARWFDPRGWLFRPRSWERDGRFYERRFAVKRWKDRLPDAAPWFPDGFAKKTLVSVDADYLARFIQETCRGEACHWAMLSAAPLFFLWNPWWADCVMIAFALTANLPCIFAQRYNRLRLTRLFHAGEGRVRLR